jgi:hypothetical protein
MESQPLDLSARSREVAVRIARIYSDVFSPMSTSAMLGFAVSWFVSPFWEGLGWGALHGVLVSLIPILFILYLLRSGRIADLHIKNRRERHLPYMVGTLCSLLALVLVHVLGGPDLLQTLLISNVTGLAALGLVNAFWQISSHLASITSAVLFAGFVYGWLVGLALAPFIALTFGARLFLRRHTVTQLVAGMALGATPVLALASVGLLG